MRFPDLKRPKYEVFLITTWCLVIISHELGEHIFVTNVFEPKKVYYLHFTDALEEQSHSFPLAATLTPVVNFQNGGFTIQLIRNINFVLIFILFFTWPNRPPRNDHIILVKFGMCKNPLET